MPLRLIRFARTFPVDGQTVSVDFEVFLEFNRSSLSVDGTVVATDGVTKGEPGMLRNHHLSWTGPDGRVL